MIEERPDMTVRENVHDLIDSLPEERLADVRDYIADLQDEETPLSPDTVAAIEEGLDDIRNGRTISLADYIRARAPQS
jgi:phage-related protein